MAQDVLRVITLIVINVLIPQPSAQYARPNSCKVFYAKLHAIRVSNRLIKFVPHAAKIIAKTAQMISVSVNLAKMDILNKETIVRQNVMQHFII
jgi:hypothetical protein